VALKDRQYFSSMVMDPFFWKTKTSQGRSQTLYPLCNLMSIMFCQDSKFICLEYLLSMLLTKRISLICINNKVFKIIACISLYQTTCVLKVKLHGLVDICAFLEKPISCCCMTFWSIFFSDQEDSHCCLQTFFHTS
jgi:hypothetical protein